MGSVKFENPFLLLLAMVPAAKNLFAVHKTVEHNVCTCTMGLIEVIMLVAELPEADTTSTTELKNSDKDGVTPETAIQLVTEKVKETKMRAMILGKPVFK